HVFATLGGRVREETGDPGVDTSGTSDTARVTPGLNDGRRFCGTPARCGYPSRIGKHHDGPGASLAGSVCATGPTRSDAATLATERHCAAHGLPHCPSPRGRGTAYCAPRTSRRSPV